MRANAAAILIMLERLAAVGPLIDPHDGPPYHFVRDAAVDMVAHAMGAIQAFIDSDRHRQIDQPGLDPAFD